MIKLKEIFSVSFIALSICSVAHADIASTGYVNQQLSGRLSSISASSSGTGNVVTSISASGGTVTATKGINAEVTSNKTTSIAASTSASDTKYPSEKAVRTELDKKADIDDVPAAITVDSALNSTSTNPVQNKVINTALAAKQNASTAVEVASAGTAVGSASQPVYVDNTGVVRAANSIPTVNNATLTIQKNGSDVGTFTANASSPATINITVPTTTSQLTNNSGFITADDLPEDYVLTAATATALGGVKSGGDIEVGTDGTVTVNSANSADSATKATQDGNGNTISSTYTKIAQGSTNANKAVITNASGNITTGTITSAMITDGTITNADISSSAEIDQSKISGLSTALAAKVDSTDLAEVAKTGSYNDLTNKPTIPTAITVDAALSSTSTNPVQNKVINTALAAKQNASTAVEVASAGTAVGSATQPVYVDNTGVVRAANSIPTVNNATLTIQKNGSSVGTFTANAANAATVNITVPTKTSELSNDSGFVTSAQLNALDSTSSGSGAVVTEVAQVNGKVTVTKGNVQIPVGSATATTYATIWVE